MAAAAGGRKDFFPEGGEEAPRSSKVYESPIAEIAKHTFNTGENKFAAQFTESQERVAGYVQRGGCKRATS